MKDNGENAFSGETIVFPTQHGKAELLAPLFSDLKISVRAAAVDTDSLGTFSGEIDRKGTIRDTLRGKIQLARNKYPERRLFLASEGSFGPHPYWGFSASDLESLLLFDAKTNSEIYAEYLTTRVINDEKEYGAQDEIQEFLERNHFPSHGVIVRPADSFQPIFKAIHDRDALDHAIFNCLKAAKNGRFIIGTDLRANHNPTRQEAIKEAGKRLLELLQSHCPDCHYPGFCIVRGIPGLPCEACGRPSSVSKDVIYRCPSCRHELVKPRPDGLKYLEAANCEDCNP